MIHKRKISSTILLAATLLFCKIPLSAQEVVPMLTTKYSQTAPYNNSCPDNSAAGCGPVAVAQILTKYKQPTHGYGSVSYQSGANKYAVDVDFENYIFDWDSANAREIASITRTPVMEIPAITANPTSPKQVYVRETLVIIEYTDGSMDIYYERVEITIDD